MSGKKAHRLKKARLSADAMVEHLDITGYLDDHTVEALRLEMTRWARRNGVTIKEFRLENAGNEPSG